MRSQTAKKVKIYLILMSVTFILVLVEEYNNDVFGSVAIYAIFHIFSVFFSCSFIIYLCFIDCFTS